MAVFIWHLKKVLLCRAWHILTLFLWSENCYINDSKALKAKYLAKSRACLIFQFYKIECSQASFFVGCFLAPNAHLKSLFLFALGFFLLLRFTNRSALKHMGVSLNLKFRLLLYLLDALLPFHDLNTLYALHRIDALHLVNTISKHLKVPRDHWMFQ